MKSIPLILLAALLVPASAFAASGQSMFSATRSLLVASSSPGNEYAAGASVVVTAPVEGDLSSVGGSIISAAPISGDALLFAGSIASRARVAGDIRAVAGSIDIEEPVGGDLVALGFSVHDSGRAVGSVFIAAANTVMTNGAAGPVTIYGNNVALEGDFAGDVTIVASGRVAFAEGTVIHGKLSYEAPEPALIPASVQAIGGVAYKNSSYLPDPRTSKLLAVASLGFFLFARILGALILAGLLTGLFPRLSEMVVDSALQGRRGRVLLTMLLGFAILVAAPVFILLLLLTFVGIGLAALLFILYALIALLSVTYAGILLGGYFAQRVMHREVILWHDGVLGMLALSLFALVPFVGFIAVLALTTFAAGALLQIFFRFAFPHEEYTPEML